MVELTQPDGERLSDLAREKIRRALAAQAVANGMLQSAQTDLEWIDAMHAQVVERRESVLGQQLGARVKALEAKSDVENVFAEVLRQDVASGDVLDVWYSHRWSQKAGRAGYDELVVGDERDRATFEQLQPGTRVILMEGAVHQLVAVDTIASPVRLVPPRGSYAGLSVEFRTDKALQHSTHNGVTLTKDSFVRVGLDGLSDNVLIDQEAIMAFLDRYEPPVLGPSDMGTSVTLEGRRLMALMDALKEYDETGELYGALPVRLSQAVGQNCREALGVTRRGALHGPAVYEAAEFLAGASRHATHYYADIFDIVARESEPRTREPYAQLFAAVENGKAERDLSIPEKAAMLKRLDDRAAELSK